MAALARGIVIAVAARPNPALPLGAREDAGTGAGRYNPALSLRVLIHGREIDA